MFLLAIALLTQPAQSRPQPRVKAAPSPQLRDDGFGVCRASTHYHAYDASNPALDGKCHADTDDRPISEPRDEQKAPLRPRR